MTGTTRTAPRAASLLALILSVAALMAAPVALTLSGAALTAAPARAQDWSSVRTPSAGPSRVIGYYTNGCLAGAQSLALAGPGYRVLRPHRNRFWGHRDMIAFVKRLARFSQLTFGRPILVADIAQPRGGPISGHASHEIGLDADIRLLLLKPEELSRAYIAKGTNLSMVVKGKEEMDRSRWSSRQVRLIRRAALDPAVDRIFVNPVIKRELCRIAGTDRRWLAKVVPWWGHDAHMHVRLHCPKGSPDCRQQKPINLADDGCGKPLKWWFEVALPRARAWFKKHPPKKRKATTGKKLPPKRVVHALPKGCELVLNGGK